ncbi:hypothetical protein EON81_23405 [bacterium]|nr:MAG: hypothetical protein EON81_23405 [bacterium]
MTDPNRDRVQREILIQAPKERVFAALTDPSTYPTWGPRAIEGSLRPGERPVLDFGEQGGGKVAVYVVAFDPPSYWAYRWVQGTSDPAILLGDPLEGTHTLVEFHVEEVEEGTRVRVVESGFASLPDSRRFETLDMPSAGWGLMLAGLARSFQPEVPVTDSLESTFEVAVPPERVYAALVDPTGWWAQSVDGRNEAGETPTWDFGPFGQWSVHIVTADAPKVFSYNRSQEEDPATDPLSSWNTLVEFRLEETPGGTAIHHSESGFLSLPAEMSEPCFRRSEQTWAVVLGILQAHLAKG